MDPEVSIKIYESAIRSVITYACASVNISTTNLKKLDKLQCTIVKRCLGLSKFALNTPLLQVVGILLISRTVELNSLELLKQCFSCFSCKDFYHTILNTNFPGTLISRVKTICKINGINLLLYTLNDKYEYNIKCPLYKQYLVKSGLKGVIDSIMGLLFHHYNNNNNKSKYSHVNIVNELLKSF